MVAKRLRERAAATVPAGGAYTLDVTEGTALAEACAAPVLYFGTGLPEDGLHGADEHVRPDVLIKGAATLAAFCAGAGGVVRRRER
jgi:acetylornithine deacetylase/succinyl-diaminopimelate desuccinylase-like protein